jgi:acyl-CoA thioesterase-1
MRNEGGSGDILYYVIVRHLSLVLALLAVTACSKGPEPEPAARAPVAIQTATARVDTRHRLVAFGDSLTAGFGAEPGASYPDFLQKLIDAKRYPWQVINAGVSGDTSTDGIARLPGVLEYKPDLVILELGANDGLRGIPVEATRSNLDQLVVALKGAGARVVLAGMTLPPNYGPEYIRPFEKVFTELAASRKLTLIPFLLAGVGGNPALMQQDGLHPTAEGNRRVAGTVMRAIEGLLNGPIEK